MREKCFIILPFVMSTCMPLTFKRFWLSRRLINYRPSILTRHQYPTSFKSYSERILLLLRHHHPTRLHLAQLNASGENQKTINYVVVSFRLPNCFIKPPHMFPLTAPTSSELDNRHLLFASKYLTQLSNSQQTNHALG